MRNLFDVSGRVVLITGSSRGLGFAFAQGFAEAGAKVIVNGTSNETVEPVVDQIQRTDGFAEGYPFDITDKAAVQEAVAQIEADIGPIDVLINNAGIQHRSPLEQMPVEDWRAVIDTNLTGVFVTTTGIVPGMIARRRGAIINISSLTAEGSRPTIAPYCSAKAGLEALTRSMAAEWGEHNIRANAIAPGYFITDMTQPLADDAEFDAWVMGNVPLNRWGDPSELLGAAIFLASDASSYITGRTISVDGGWRAAL